MPRTAQTADSELRVSIVIGSRFHAFDLARELAVRGALHRLVTGYPRRYTGRFGVPARKVVSLPLTLVVHRGLNRMAPALDRRLAAHLNAAFARRASRKLDGTGVLHGWSGYSLESLRWAHSRSIPRVVERSSSHIVTQMELLEREYADVGLPFERAAQRWMDRDQEEYELADLIAVPSLFARRSFLQRGFAESRLLHAPFGADLESFSPGPKRDEVFRVVYAGALSVRKGIHHLVDAFRLADLPRSELRLIGSWTPETPVVLRKADQRVVHVPHVPQSELVQHYRDASVFVIASIEEGLAVVQAQALASGLPLICTQNTGGEDLLLMSGPKLTSHEGRIDEYGAGYVVPIRDPAAIARCLTWLAQDPHKLEQKKLAAAAIRSRALGWSDYADRVVTGYRRLVG